MKQLWLSKNILANMDNIPKKNLVFALFICTFIVYGFSLVFSLKTPHFSPNNDFSNHAHLMYRFAESFKSGQLIPRTVVSPTIFSDATIETANIPTFQYYGFLEGAVALPFHLLHISYTNAAVLSSILIRFAGILFLFETCLLLNCSTLTALLASISLLISPYTLTVFYGRGALSEVFAQSLLTLIPYGYALASRGRTPQAIIAFAMAFFLLALCHNIFFLYGLLFLAILALFSLQFKVMVSAAIGTCLGILMSAWQWLPAHHTIKDIVIFGPLNSWKLGAHVETQTASLSGALGIPQPLQPIGLDTPLPIYFTIGWWTLPFILLSVRVIWQKNNSRLAFSFFIAAIIFFALTFEPLNEIIFRHVVPQLFSIVQTTSRLISFISLLGAICLAITLPKISPRVFQLLLILMLVSQLPVFACYFKLVSQKSWTNNEIIGAPINYYYSNPIYSNSIIQPKENDGTFNDKNRFYVTPEKYHRFFVRLNGYNTQPNVTLNVAIAALNQKTGIDEYEVTSLQSKRVIFHSSTSTMIEMPAVSKSGWYRILLSANYMPNQPHASIILTQMDIIPENLSNFIFAEQLENTKKVSGYSRQYQLINSKKLNLTPDQERYYTLELPTAYSRLFTVTQNKKELDYLPDFNHRMIVITKDLQSPINVHYTIDYKTLLLVFLGFIGFTTTLVYKKRQSHAQKMNQ